jgi:hypothetical protein
MWMSRRFVSGGDLGSLRELDDGAIGASLPLSRLELLLRVSIAAV